MNFYAQLYSVKDYKENDLMIILEEIAKQGYCGVEFAGYGGYSSLKIKEKLKSLNLIGVSSHVSFEQLQNNLKEEISFLKDIGAKYIVCPYTDLNTCEKAIAYAELLNSIGKICYNEGLILAYHNHAHEFEKDNGKYPLEVFFDNVNTKYVKQQPDVFWIAYAGLDPVKYVQEHADRIVMVHLKQLDSYKDKNNVRADLGSIDFKKIIQSSKTDIFIYEQETFKEDCMDSMAKSILYLNTIGGDL